MSPAHRPPRSAPETFEEAAERIIRALRPGDVVTYGDVALEAGRPRAARAVGNVLAKVHGLPWWRVVHADGRLVPGHEAEQARRLRADGVEVHNHRVRRPPAHSVDVSGRSTTRNVHGS